MTTDELKRRQFEQEFVFSASRSSGAGGQNVNKVNTKVELRFSINASQLLNPLEKDTVYTKLKNKINQDGDLIITSQTERTQLGNKEKTIEKFYTILAKALTINKKRKATKPSLSSNEKRLKQKKTRSQHKALRGKVELN